MITANRNEIKIGAVLSQLSREFPLSPNYHATVRANKNETSHSYFPAN
jgi:hypothetical protein